MTIPVGIFGVTSVNTMLDTAGGVETGGTLSTFSATGANSALTAYAGDTAYAEVVLNFNSACSGATEATFTCTGTAAQETLYLYNGLTQENILGGYCPTCTGTVAATTGNYYVADGSTNYLVKTGVEYSGTLNSNGSGNVPPSGTSLVLNYQEFPVFSEYQNDYLVSVQVYDTGGNSGSTYSREVLSGVSVQEAASSTPEPGSVFLLLGGFGLIGFSRLRRQRC